MFLDVFFFCGDPFLRKKGRACKSSMVSDHGQTMVSDHASATGGLREAEADLAPQRMRPTASRAPDGGVGAWREPALLTPPRGLRSGTGNAAPVTSLNKIRANAPLEPASRCLRGC